MDKILHHLAALVVPGILDLLELDFCLFVRILLSLLVPARVLQQARKR